MDSGLGHGLQLALAAVARDPGVKVLGHQSVVEPIEERMGHQQLEPGLQTRSSLGLVLKVGKQGLALIHDDGPFLLAVGLLNLPVALRKVGGFHKRLRRGAGWGDEVQFAAIPFQTPSCSQSHLAWTLFGGERSQQRLERCCGQLSRPLLP